MMVVLNSLVGVYLVMCIIVSIRVFCYKSNAAGTNDSDQQAAADHEKNHENGSADDIEMSS